MRASGDGQALLSLAKRLDELIEDELLVEPARAAAFYVCGRARKNYGELDYVENCAHEAIEGYNSVGMRLHERLGWELLGEVRFEQGNFEGEETAYEMAFAGVTRATRPEEVHLLARTDEPVPATTTIPSGLRVPMPEALGIPGCNFYFDADEARDEERWIVQGIRRITMAGDGCDTRVIFASAWFEDDTPLAGGVVAKPGGAPLGEGEVPLLELVDVTFDGVPEVRIHAWSGRQERAAFFRIHPDGRSLVHLAAMFFLPNPRPDPASRTIETSSAPTMAQHDTSAYAWRAGRLEKVRHRYTLHEHLPNGGSAPRDHAWQTEVVLRAGGYEVVSDGLVRADPH